MEKKIIIFTLTGCPYCTNLKKRLDDLSITYVDIDVDEHPDLWDKVTKQTNENVLPTIFIQYPNTKEGDVYIPGTNYDEEDEIVEILKNIVKKEGN